MENKIKAGDLIECDAAMFYDPKVGQKVEVHADEMGLYVLGGPGANVKLYLYELSISKYTDEAFAMCLGHSFIKRQNEVSELPLRGSELTKKLLEQQKYVFCLVSDVSDEDARKHSMLAIIESYTIRNWFSEAGSGLYRYAVPIGNNGDEIMEIESC